MGTRDDLRAECERHGFTFDTYSPGDGVTRYRFFTVSALGRRFGYDYFAGRGDFTALGLAEAQTYALGRCHGAARREGDA